MSVARLGLLLAIPMLLVPSAAAAQRVGAALHPDTVRVGDVFSAAVRIEVPPGHTAILPDSLELDGDLERAGPVTRIDEPLEDGGTRVTASYPLSAWRPGQTELPPIAIEVAGPDSSYRIEARLPTLEVRSVLPADAEGPLTPRPPKDVLGPNYLLWPFLLAGLALLLALAALYLWWRRHRALAAPAEPAVPPPSPREYALAELDRVRAEGLLEARAFKPFYARTSDAVRRYLDALNDSWGSELTTSELVVRARGEMPVEALLRLTEFLEAADLVKFARYRPTPEEADAAWRLARDWVAEFEWYEVEEGAEGVDGAEGVGGGHEESGPDSVRVVPGTHGEGAGRVEEPRGEITARVTRPHGVTAERAVESNGVPAERVAEMNGATAERMEETKGVPATSRPPAEAPAEEES